MKKLFFLLGKVPHDDSPIEKMCEVTGGRSYRIKSHFVLNQCIESLVQKVQPGVVVQFEQMQAKDLKDGEVQDIAFQTTKKMIYVAKHPTQKNQFPVGFWPIPEPYWPDPKAPNLPPRDAHPKLRIMTPYVDEPSMVRNFPVDKYEVEASPLTLQILSKREANKCWPVVVSNGIHNLELPFGYLKTCPPFTQVFLVILPYNYPVLLPLVNELLHKYNSTPPPDWIYKFSSYFRQVPPYYGPFLRRALSTANVPYNFLQYILPENLDSYLSQNVASYLKTMKNTAKQEQENMCLRVFKQLKLPKPPYHQIETVKLNSVPLKRELVTHPQLRDTFSKMHSEMIPFENHVIVVPTVLQQSSAKNFRNPFDVPRSDLIDELARMRDNFYKVPAIGINVSSKDAGHCLPISEMGNYQEYLKNKETPLREIEPTNVRQHMFGNPYKKDKHMVMVDEADLGDVAPMKPNANTPTKKVVEPNNRQRKRKPGPIRKDYIFRRTSTDSINGDDSQSGSSNNSMFDSDMDDMNSETSSVRSDDDTENDLIIDFEFNEPSAIEEGFNMNGHIKNFIEMDPAEDVCEPIVPLIQSPQSPHTISPSVGLTTDVPVSQTDNALRGGKHFRPLELVSATAATIAATPSAQLLTPTMGLMGPTNTFMPAHFTPQPISMPISPQHPPPTQSTTPTISTITVSPHASFEGSANGKFEVLKFLGSSQQQINGPIPVTTVDQSSSKNYRKTQPCEIPGTAPSPPTSVTTVQVPVPIIPHHNDLNDATEISKILQQCHNGSSGSNGGSGGILDQTHSHHKSNRHSIPNDKEDNHKMDVDNDIIFAPIPQQLQLHQHHANNYLPHHNNDTHIISDTTIKRENATPNENHEEDIVDDEEHKENIKQSNLNARKVIFQDIRRPGRDYSLLLDHLNMVKGNLETKLQFIQMCIEESQRFRRKKMADCIQEWWDKYTDGVTFGT